MIFFSSKNAICLLILQECTQKFPEANVYKSVDFQLGHSYAGDSKRAAQMAVYFVFQSQFLMK